MMRVVIKLYFVKLRDGYYVDSKSKEFGAYSANNLWLSIQDISRIKEYIRKTFGGNVSFKEGSVDECYHKTQLTLMVKFHDQADEAYFQLCSNNGLEI